MNWISVEALDAIIGATEVKKSDLFLLLSYVCMAIALFSVFADGLMVLGWFLVAALNMGLSIYFSSKRE